MTKLTAAAVILLLALPALLGCRDSDPATPAATTPASDAATSPSTIPASSASPGASPPATVRTPDEAEDLIEAAFARDNVLSPFDLDADVKAGAIELQGVVQSDEQKTHAEQVARQIASGISIDNRIRVERRATPSVSTSPAGGLATPGVILSPASADEAEDYVDAALTLDDELRGFDLEADEANGGIVLKGIVQTDEQKAEAEQLAQQYAPGFMVDNQIKVDASVEPRRDVPRDADEAEDMIEAAYTLDPALHLFDLNVKHDSTSVTLTGTVQTAEQKAAAEQLAQQYAGSFSVINQIDVRSG